MSDSRNGSSVESALHGRDISSMHDEIRSHVAQLRAFSSDSKCIEVDIHQHSSVETFRKHGQQLKADSGLTDREQAVERDKVGDREQRHCESHHSSDVELKTPRKEGCLVGSRGRNKERKKEKRRVGEEGQHQPEVS
eukprot:CAMPEP_0170103368 /NCGR_PEP_ID=MMETSP0020_2-20130122/3453_1 /TAXON_ID=98059 /ORGANISM="Dinobryon sp., Strain UTEXLB2267" /LENGTH=136 /DNA_ID=CAMNT_0010326923 /DNA_START=387 /DNA_END=798 /DNA_ORIENTATION=+